MHIKAIENIADQLVEISKAALPPGKGDGPFKGLWMHDEIAYSLPQDRQEQFNEIIRLILKENHFSEKFTEGYISKKLKSIFADLIKGQKIDLIDIISKMIEELEKYNEENTVYVPVTGIRMSVDLDIGNIHLLRATDEILEQVRERIRDIVEKSKTDEEKKPKIIASFVKEMEQALGSHTLALYTVVAEPSRAYERAKEETRRALELFRFASKAIYPMSDDIRVGLKGEPAYDTRTAFVFSENSLSTKSDNEGSIRPFEYDGNTKARMDEIGVFKVSDILKKDNQTNFEEVVLRAIHWFSSALQQSEIENSFLSLIIALETIFTAERGNPITNTVAEGTALVLAKELEPRKMIKRRIKDYYGMRSGIAHGGKKTILVTDYYNLINIVGSIIVLLIEKTEEFESHKSFTDWIEETKLK